MKTLKIAFCLFKYFKFGGLQRDFLRIAKECIDRGHAVTVYTMAWEGEKIAGLTVKILPKQSWQNHTRILHYITALKNQLATQSFDLIVGFNKIPGLDVYYAADTCYQAKIHRLRSFWYRLLPRYRQLQNFEQAVFAPNNKTKILLIAKQQQKEFMQYYQTPASRFHLLPPGIARDRLASKDAPKIRQETRSEYHLTNDDNLVLMIGSGFKTKGLDRSMRAIAALPDSLQKKVKLMIIGEDYAKPFLKLAKHLKIAENILFLGGRDDIPRFLLAADLLLHPAYNENTGTVLLEAIASGLPVLTTDVCGYADYILEANAGEVLPSPFQQAQLNKKLLAMLQSSNRPTWSKNGIHFAKTADIYHLPQRAVDLLESFVSC